MVAAPRPWADMTQALLDVAREHQRTLQGSIPRRERDLREASASLDRNSALIVEIEARRKLAALPPLRPGQYGSASIIATPWISRSIPTAWRGAW
jgi:hypothetical protein